MLVNASVYFAAESVSLNVNPLDIIEIGPVCSKRVHIQNSLDRDVKVTVEIYLFI